MYNEDNGLRIKVPAFVANDLIKYLPEGCRPTRYIVGLILEDLAKHKRGSQRRDHIPVRDNNIPD